jgi:hypothetical protein
MTRFPTETRQVTGLEGEAYELPTSVCANPDCEYEATDKHHLFSRGLMGGAFNWVRLADGTETGNLVGLCFLCHKKITENKSQITYQNNKFYFDKYPLRYQPPKNGNEIESSGEDAALPSSPDAKQVCPTCHRKIPRPKIKNPQEESKPRKTWSVAVPYDNQEDGAEVIDQLLDICEDKMDKHGLNWSGGNRVMYYKLTAALALFAQHADEILSDN